MTEGMTMNATEMTYVIETLAQELDVRTPNRASSHELNRSLVREFIDTYPERVSDAIREATMGDGTVSPFVITKHLVGPLETHARLRVLPGQS